MRLPSSAHTSHPWRIHELTPDFRLEDVWAIKAPGGQEDFTETVRAMSSFDPSRSSSLVVRALFAIRWKLGELLGWDDDSTGLDNRVPTLRERLPEDLLARPGPPIEGAPFRSLYLTDDEFAAEIANQTMHGVLHVGLAPDPAGGHRGQFAVLVKPNGPLGSLYMAAIRPIRHLFVYPPLLRELEQRMNTSTTPGSSTEAGTETESPDRK